MYYLLFSSCCQVCKIICTLHLQYSLVLFIVAFVVSFDTKGRKSYTEVLDSVGMLTADVPATYITMAVINITAAITQVKAWLEDYIYINTERIVYLRFLPGQDF